MTLFTQRTISHAIIAFSAMITSLFQPQNAVAQSVPITTNIRVWLDASDVAGTGTNPANGAVLSQWADKSGNANHMNSTGLANVTYETTGLNGLPSVRLIPDATLTGPNIFPGITAPEATIFLVHSRESTLSNFAVNLNGESAAGSGTSARYSIHLPWGDGKIYFDAGGCCTTTRLTHVFQPAIGEPNLITAGNSINGFSGFTSVSQFLRVNAATTASDNTAIAAPVTAGLHLGTRRTYKWDGRFSEIIIYDRALSLSEIEEVECYLIGKWNLPSSGLNCSAPPVVINLNKSAEAFASPSGTGFETPGDEIIYTIAVSHASGSAFDPGSLLVVDRLPDAVEFFNGDLDGTSGPFTDAVGFTNTGSNLTWNFASNVGFASGATAPSDFSQCSYAPVAGYDPNVKFICIAPSGSLDTGQASFKFRARIK